MNNEILQRFDLDGRTVVITGGGGELCGAMADALGMMGVKVAVLDISLEKGGDPGAGGHPVRWERPSLCVRRPGCGPAPGVL